MVRITPLLVAAALVGTACSSDSGGTAPTPTTPTTPTDAPTTETPSTPTSRPEVGAECGGDLGDALAEWGDAGFSGSIATLESGAPTCLAAFGVADRSTDTPITPDTTFSIGSITKAVTAAAIAQLADDGTLSLDDTAGDWLSDLTSPVADLTIRDLLLHTGGLNGTHARESEPLSRDDAIAAIDRLEIAFEPGTDFLYSNAGYVTLALIVEAASDTDYRTYVADRLLTLPDGRRTGGWWNGEPAAPSPRAIGYRDDGSPGQAGDIAGPYWAVDGSGGVAMTPIELAEWTRELFAGDLLTPGARDIVTAVGFDQGDGTGEAAGWVAFDDALVGEAGFGSSGGDGEIAHNMGVAWFPDSDRVIVVASNTPDVRGEVLLERILPAWLAGEPIPRPNTPTDSSIEVDPNDLSGDYRFDDGSTATVSVDGGRLVVATDGAGAVNAVFPPGDDATAAERDAHEDRVRALLAGETAEGREELAALESDLGSLDEIRIVGTIFADFEFRTYVEASAAGSTVGGWYAVNAEGGIEGAEFGSGLPELVLVADGDTFRPDDPTGLGPDVTIEFDGDRLLARGPGGTTTTATRTS